MSKQKANFLGKVKSSEWVSVQGPYDKYTPIDRFLCNLRELGYHAVRKGDMLELDCPTLPDLNKAIHMRPKNEPLFSIDMSNILSKKASEMGITKEELIRTINKTLNKGVSR